MMKNQKQSTELREALKSYVTPYKKIRFGGDHGEPGYVMLDLPKEYIGDLISPGTGTGDFLHESKFDIQFSEYYGCDVYMFDGAAGTPSEHLTERMHFFNRNVYSKQDIMSSIKYPKEWMTMQMDIEGAEHKVLENPKDWEFCSQIALELHINVKKLQSSIDLLNRMNEVFKLVHIHPVNTTPPRYRSEADKMIDGISCCLELTYVNRNIFDGNERYTDGYPTAIDKKCHPVYPEPILTGYPFTK